MEQQLSVLQSEIVSLRVETDALRADNILLRAEMLGLREEWAVILDDPEEGPEDSHWQLFSHIVWYCNMRSWSLSDNNQYMETKQRDSSYPSILDRYVRTFRKNMFQSHHNVAVYLFYVTAPSDYHKQDV